MDGVDNLCIQFKRFHPFEHVLDCLNKDSLCGEINRLIKASKLIFLLTKERHFVPKLLFNFWQLQSVKQLASLELVVS